jgi:MFS transporter, Spinster family, sphingosine-1-phosphate transporter
MGDANKSGSMRLAYWSLAALFGMNLLNYIDRFILAAVLEKVRSPTELDFDYQKAGLLSTVFFVSYAFFSPIMGWLGDRMTRRYLLAVGVGIWSIATFGSAWADSYWHLMLARSVLGIGEATYATLAPTLIGDLFPRKQRNRALSLFYVAIPLGAALGYSMGGFIEAHFGWRMAFQVVGWPGLFVAVAALFLPEPKRGASEHEEGSAVVHSEALPLTSKTYLQLFHNRSYVYNLLAMAMGTFALGGLQWWTPSFLETNRGIARDVANYWLGVTIVISGLVGTLAGGWLGDWFTPRMRGAYFWVSGVGMFVSAPFIFLALRSGQPVVIYGSILIGLTLAFLNYGPSNSIIVNVSMPNIRAAAFAVNTFAIHLLGDIPSPFAMGAISQATGDLFWGMLITIPALALSGLFFCLGGPHLEADQDAVTQAVRSGAV